MFSSKHPSPDDDDDIRRNDRKHGVHNRPNGVSHTARTKAPAAAASRYKENRSAYGMTAGFIADGIGLQPDTVGRFQRIMLSARRDYNQEFWWKPGEPLPERAPDSGQVSR